MRPCRVAEGPHALIARSSRAGWNAVNLVPASRHRCVLTAEQSALGKLLANWNAVIVGRAAVEDRRRGQATFDFGN